jgi:hypothetical protein
MLAAFASVGAAIEVKLTDAKVAGVFGASGKTAATVSLPPPHPLNSEDASAGPSGSIGALARNLRNLCKSRPFYCVMR